MNNDEITLEPYEQDTFRGGWLRVEAAVHENAVRHGFWDEKRNPAECIALMHSELSEALEVIRKAKPTSLTTVGVKQATAVELADCVIRIMDYAAAAGLPVATAILEKHAYNCTRPHKHGKAF